MTHKPFGIVLGGGGARGLAHVGVLKTLNHLGLFPSAIIGVSMGAVVAAAYALNDDWYHDFVEMDNSGFPSIPDFQEPGVRSKLKNAWIAERAAHAEVFGWGPGEEAVEWGRGVLNNLTKGKSLEEGRIPVFTSATDMLTGTRVVKSRGSAVDAVYASSALAGVLPPFPDGEHLLIDGGYSDMAPVDVLRDIGINCVIGIDLSQKRSAELPKNGFQAMLRSLEITQNAFAQSRFEQADLVLRPHFKHTIGVLDYQYKRDCIAAGADLIRESSSDIRDLLRSK